MILYAVLVVTVVYYSILLGRFIKLGGLGKFIPQLGKEITKSPLDYFSDDFLYPFFKFLAVFWVLLCFGSIFYIGSLIK